MLGCLVALTMLAISGCSSSADLVLPTETRTTDSDADLDAPDINASPAAVPMELDTDGPAYLHRDAKQRLRVAKRSLVRAGTGRFVRTTMAGDADHRVWKKVIQMKGSYDLPRLRSRNTLRLFDETGDSVTFRVRTQRRRTFIRASEWRCWLTMTSADFERGSGVRVPPGSTHFPMEVLGLIAARPATLYHETNMVVATVPLAVASSLAGPVVDRKLRGRRAVVRAGVRVPVLIRVRSNRFVSWSLHGVDLLAALEDSSIRLGRQLRKGLPYLDIRIRLRAPGLRVRVPIPPASERVRPDEFDAESCGAPAVV